MSSHVITPAKQNMKKFRHTVTRVLSLISGGSFYVRTNAWKEKKPEKGVDDYIPDDDDTTRGCISDSDEDDDAATTTFLTTTAGEDDVEEEEADHAPVDDGSLGANEEMPEKISQTSELWKKTKNSNDNNNSYDNKNNNNNNNTLFFL